MVEIIKVQGSLEERTASAKRIKAEFEEFCPEMAALRLALIDEDMLSPSFSAIASVSTPNIDFNRERDDPRHFDRKFAAPPAVSRAQADAEASTARRASVTDTKARYEHALAAKKAVRK